MSAHLHHMRAEWDGRFGGPSLRVVCSAPPEALCRADWSCECESWDEHGIDADGPWHQRTVWDDEESTVRCYGKPGGECTFEVFINESDCAEEMGSGEIVFPISFEWDGDSYAWSAIDPESVPS